MKTVLRVALFILGAVSVLLNIGPVLTSGEINIGIITGLGTGILFFLISVSFNKAAVFLSRFRRTPRGKIIIAAVSLLMCLCIGVGGLTFIRILTYSRKPANKTEYIIVLGCQVSGTRPGIHLSGRINKAYEYLKQNPGSKAILSGGQGSNENISEGRCMFNSLKEKGIDPSRLIVEDRSTSTIENFRNSVEDLRNNNVEIHEITIITNDFHEYRASRIAERNGLTAFPYPSKTHWTGYLPFAIREVYAVIWQIYLH